MSSDEEDRDCTLGGIESVVKLEKYFQIQYDTGEQARLYILNGHVFRYYMSPTGVFLDYPEPINPDDKAKITVKSVDDYDPEYFQTSTLKDTELFFVILTKEIEIFFDKIQGTMNVRNDSATKQVLNESNPICYADNKTTQMLYQNKDEYFFGGGMQNGRYKHKGKIVQIVNTNNWLEGGVTSPCPFYWSTNGYGVLRNTWQPGVYDFGSESLDTVKTTHKGLDFDVFYFINPHPKDILADYFELTGTPILMPQYAFYEAHLNTFNRDYWVKVEKDTPGAILFEDGHYYKSYKPGEIKDKSKAILESLNGNKHNYQFSARAMIDRYKKHDMPLGWFVPNDGYGSGYGQTSSLKGDIENLKKFAIYARQKGVEVALWTESNLEPVDPKHPKKGDRDLHREVSVAGVVALKCDVAWIGSGYSFGLNAVEHAAELFEKAAKERRKMIIMVDGWAGTQRHAGIWSGDQSGGQWEYIRFHIPTYIGAGLSGIPVVGSDMDGIYEGGVKNINIRDYQWKAFTPLQLNMDGWGNTPKTPFSYDDEAKAINRAFLKMKSMLMPYNYSLGYEATQGLPMIRAMFLQYPHNKTAYTLDCKYQYMWGSNILVAPIYNGECDNGVSVRHGIFLPEAHQVWCDLFTGKKYRGGKVYNNMKFPLWRIPVYVRDGCVVPMVDPNNNPKEIKADPRIFNVFPGNSSNFHVYEDDGISSDYLSGQFAQTVIELQIVQDLRGKSDLYINIEKTTGSYKGMVKERTTLFRIMCTKDVDRVKAALNGKPFTVSKVHTEAEFEARENVFFFKPNFILNPYLEPLGGSEVAHNYLMIKIQKVDVTESQFHVKVVGHTNETNIFANQKTVVDSLQAPSDLSVVEDEVTPTSITLQWKEVTGAIFYELEIDEVIHTNIIGTEFVCRGFKYESEHKFRIRSVINEGFSQWSDYINAITKEDPYTNTVKSVKVTCTLPCQKGQEISHLCSNDELMWHTDWGSKGRANENQCLKLNFDLGDVYNIEKIEYVPRDNAGNGTFLEIMYKISIDGETWYELNGRIELPRTDEIKLIMLNGSRFRYMEMSVIKSVGDFGSGKQIRFYVQRDG